MSNFYSSGKRQRESEQQQRQREKEERRALRRRQGPSTVEIVDASEIQGGLPSIESALRAIENGASGGTTRAAATIPTRLFVGGLSDETTERDLRALFEAYGPVTDVVVMKERDSQRPRGFGFVTMANRRDAPNAIAALSGSEFKGRTLVINVATDRGR